MGMDPTECGGGAEMATGHFGTLASKQTVPRAEMQALIAFLQFSDTLDTIGSTIIHTDAKIVHDGVNKGPKVKHGGVGTSGKNSGKHTMGSLIRDGYITSSKSKLIPPRKTLKVGRSHNIIRMGMK